MNEIEIISRSIPAKARSGYYQGSGSFVQGGVSAGQTVDISGKLDAAVFYKAFALEFDEADPSVLTGIKALAGLHTDQYLSALGLNPGGGGGGGGGATTLGELANVGEWADEVPQADRVLVQLAGATHWSSKPLSELVGLDEEALAAYLVENGYATQEWVNTKLGSYATTSAMNSALGNKVDKVAGKGLSSNDFTDALLTKLNGIEEGANKYVLPTATGSVLGGVKVGATLAIASGVLNMKVVGTAGTYTKVTVDAYGRVTGHASLAATDIPNLPWSKITSGKPTTLAGYGITDAYTKQETDTKLSAKLDKATFEELFEKVQLSDGTFAIHAKFGLYSDSFLSVLGMNPDGGSGGASSLSELSDVSLSGLQDGQALTWDAAAQKWMNKTLEAGLDEEALAEYLTDNQYAKKGDISIAGLTDLHSSWDALLKAAKPATLAGYGITDAYTKTDADGRYVLKTGDTITGNLSVMQIIMQNSNEINSNVANGTLYLAYRGTTGGVNLCNNNAPLTYGSARYAILHAGNYASTLDSRYLLKSSYTAADVLAKLKTVDGSGSGLDADTVDGVHNGNLSAAVLNSRGRSGMITGKPTTAGLQMFEVYSDGDDYPVGFGNLLRLRGGTSSGSGELLLGWSGTNNGIEHIYYRNNRDMVETWSEWRTVAFTTDNVASATKLQTARTIWGQSFDGRANVSGNMTGVGSISASGNIMTDNALFQIDATNISGDRGLNVLYNGQRLFCGFGTSGTKGLFIKHSGSSPGWVLSVPSSTVVAIAQDSGINVGIGTTSPTSKLHVSGDAYASGYFKTNGWFQNNVNGCGLYNSAQNARWYASRGCWNTDKPIIPNSDNAYTVGTSSYRFNYGYFTNMNVNVLTVNVNATLNGMVTCNNNIVFNQIPIVNAGARYLYFGSNYEYGRIGWEDSTNFYIQGVSTGGTMHLCARNAGKLAVIDMQADSVNLSDNLTAQGTIYSKIGVYSDGYVSALGNNTSSDMRLKTKLSDIALTPKDIANAPAMLFAWKKNGMKDVGSSAQYWKNVLPDAVKERDGWLEMAYGNIALVSAISIAKKVVSHEERIAQLEKENIGLKNKIKELERRIAP